MHFSGEDTILTPLFIGHWIAADVIPYTSDIVYPKVMKWYTFRQVK